MPKMDPRHYIQLSISYIKNY